MTIRVGSLEDLYKVKRCGAYLTYAVQTGPPDWNAPPEEIVKVETARARCFLDAGHDEPHTALCIHSGKFVAWPVNK